MIPPATLPAASETRHGRAVACSPDNSALAGVVFGRACQLHIFEHDPGALPPIAVERPSDLGGAFNTAKSDVRHKDAVESTSDGHLASMLPVGIDLDCFAHAVEDEVLKDDILDSSLVGRQAFDIRYKGSAGECHVPVCGKHVRVRCRPQCSELTT